jgi:hypothetical protein
MDDPRAGPQPAAVLEIARPPRGAGGTDRGEHRAGRDAERLSNGKEMLA